MWGGGWEVGKKSWVEKLGGGVEREVKELGGVGGGVCGRGMRMGGGGWRVEIRGGGRRGG